MTKPKSPAALSMDALLVRRRGLLAALDDVDAELGRRGVRPTYKPAGAPRSVALLVAAALADGPHSAKEIAERTGQTLHAVHQMLYRLTGAGEVRRVERGLYALPASPEAEIAAGAEADPYEALP